MRQVAISGCLLLPVLAGACVATELNTTAPPELESSMELFSWWTEPGETEALETLISLFQERHPEVSITNAAAANADEARSRLKERLDLGEPPDSFQAISGVDLLHWVEEGKMTSLSTLAEEEGWFQVFPTAVLDSLSRDGQLYAVPANIERDNNLYYNVKVLADADIQPPATREEFKRACDTLRSTPDAPIPLAVPAAGWVLAILAFETLMPAVLGGDYYLDFFRGNASPSESDLTTLFEELQSILLCSNVSTAESSWTAQADLLRRGDAAMYVMGDWAKGYLEGEKDADGHMRASWKAETDFDVVPALGSRRYFTFNSAVFGLPSGALHPKAARAFLALLGSKEGQQAFNPTKGSVPARTDVDLQLFDNMVKGAADDFQDAAENNTLLPGYPSLTPYAYQKKINPALLVFAVGGARAKELDPVNVSDDESSIPPLQIDYIVQRLLVSYSILADDSGEN